MLPTKFSFYGLSLIALIFWLSVNDAVPSGPYANREARPATSQPSKAWQSTKKTLPVTGQPASFSGTSKVTAHLPIESRNTRKSNTIFNSNINMNEIYTQPIRSEWKHPRSHKEPIKNDINDVDDESATDSEEESNSDSSGSSGSDVEANAKKILGSARKMEELPINCTEEGVKEPSMRSFPANKPPIEFANAFEVPGKAEARKTSSVHTGEDITLCWIETKTIKEDPAFDPPKRLVIREFTISFENSAAIPNSYLECTKMVGEVAEGDEKDVCKSSLHEVIIANTKRSRIGNFTSVSHVGPILVHQEKTVRCAMGSVLSKNIYEWPNGSDNPKKRVEMKVGPIIRDIDTSSDRENGKCTIKPGSGESEENRNPSSVSDCTSGESCETSVTCEHGEECNVTSKASSCEDGTCATSSFPEETVATTYLPDSNGSFSTDITTTTTTKSPEESLIPKNLTKPVQEESHLSDENPCPEYDTNCKLTKTTIKPETSSEKVEICSGEDCSGGSDGSANAVSSDESEDTANTCSGDNCTGKGESDIATTDGFEGIASTSSKPCHESSGGCSCNESSCSMHSSEESSTLGIRNEMTDRTTIPPVDGTNETTLKESECDSEFGECAASSETTSNDKENPNVESKTDVPVETEFPDAISPTQVPESDLVSSKTTTLSPCDSSESEGCPTVAQGPKELLHELSSEKEEYPATTENTGSLVTKHSVTKEVPEASETEPSNEEGSSSCAEGSTDVNCQSAGTSSESEFEDTIVKTDSSHEVYDSNDSISSTSGAPEEIKYPFDNAVTPIPIASTDSTTPMFTTSTELPESINDVTLLNEELASSKEESMTACSLDESGDCDKKKTDSPSLDLQETTTSPESCEFSGSCEPVIMNSTDMHQSKPINSTNTDKSPDLSSCHDSTESCETPSSAISSEICDDGSSNGDCTRNSSIPDSCDPSSGSCSSETNTSTGLIDATTTTTTKTTAKELEGFSTTIDNVSITAETRRSTTSSLPLITPSTKGRHKLALKIKVLLEHINEKKEKEKLVQVEKHLLLNEKPEEHGNHSLLWKIKSLSNSMNMETFRSIFNRTGLEQFTEAFSNLTEFKRNSEERVFGQKIKEIERSTFETEDETQYNSREGSNESSSRKKRDINDSKGNGVMEKNLTDVMTANAIRESLPGVNEDFQKGLDHVLGRISQELNDQGTSGVTKPAESSPSKILEILADPTDRRIRSQRSKRASKVSVEELEIPMTGEEIDRWSNERFVKAADGSRVRSLLEFRILRDPREESRGIFSGL